MEEQKEEQYFLDKAGLAIYDQAIREYIESRLKVIEERLNELQEQINEI